MYLDYAKFMELTNVRRMGVAKCGSNGRPATKNGLNKITEPFFAMREQSDAEHVFGTMLLATLLSDYYPEQFPRADERDYLLTMLYHELGEVASGDVPDDGTRDNRSQDQKEFDFIRGFLTSHYPTTAGAEKLALYSAFLNKDSDIGRNAFLIDKVDAILFNLYLESCGRAGSINWRIKHFGSKPAKGRTLSDKECVEITGSDKPADVWLCALVYNSDAIKYPTFSIFKEIIQSAAFVVRGETMRWFDNFNYKKEIFTP